jgi:hypothetical protein
MNRTLIILLLGTLLIYGSSHAQIRSSLITIDEIGSNEYIRGSVSGISPKETEDFCVLVYVHTDKWYIHPYAIGGRGKSWTVVDDGKSWTIPTIKREFPADQLAAVLLKKNSDGQCVAPARVHHIQGIAPERYFAIRNLKGTADYGKL